MAGWPRSMATTASSAPTMAGDDPLNQHKYTSKTMKAAVNVLLLSLYFTVDSRWFGSSKRVPNWKSLPKKSCLSKVLGLGISQVLTDRGTGLFVRPTAVWIGIFTAM